MARNEKWDGWTCFLIGCGVGAGAAMLFAPKMGKEMREGLSGAAMLFASKLGQELRGEIAEVTRLGQETAHEIANDLEKTAREISGTFVDEAKKTIARSADRILEAVEGATKTMDKSLDQLSEAIEVGKQAYKEEKYGRDMQS